MNSQSQKFLLYLPADRYDSSDKTTLTESDANRTAISGPIAVALNVAESFVNANIPAVLIFNGHPKLFRLFERTGIDVRRFDMPANSVKKHFNPLYRRRHSKLLADFVDREQVDTLYLFNNGGYLLHYIRKLNIFKICTQIAGEPDPQPIKMFHRGFTLHPKSLLKAWYRKYVRLNYSGADLVVCGSNAARELALRTYGIEPERAKTVDWGVASKLSASTPGAIRREFNIPQGSKIVLSVGRITKAKGVEDFGELARIIIARSSGVYRFLFAGPELEPSYGRMVRQKYGKFVTFIGSRLDISNAYADADLYVHTSHRESGPQTIIEAMEFGVPSVAWDIPGCNSLIVSEQNGSLIKFGDLIGMADSVESLLNDSDKYERFSATAISMFDRYSNENYSPNLMKVIKDRKLLMGIS